MQKLHVVWKMPSRKQQQPRHQPQLQQPLLKKQPRLLSADVQTRVTQNVFIYPAVSGLVACGQDTALRNK